MDQTPTRSAAPDRSDVGRRRARVRRRFAAARPVAARRPPPAGAVARARLSKLAEPPWALRSADDPPRQESARPRHHARAIAPSEARQMLSLLTVSRSVAEQQGASQWQRSR